MSLAPRGLELCLDRVACRRLQPRDRPRTVRHSGSDCYTSPVTDGRHAVAEDVILALRAAVADRVRADPSLLEHVKRRVDGWLRSGTVARAYAEAWREILARPADEVARFLEDPGERARQLRQSSPFAGVIDPRTRWAIWRRVRRGGESR